mgnify:CR=1 FL=1
MSIIKINRSVMIETKTFTHGSVSPGDYRPGMIHKSYIVGYIDDISYSSYYRKTINFSDMLRDIFIETQQHYYVYNTNIHTQSLQKDNTQSYANNDHEIEYTKLWEINYENIDNWKTHINKLGLVEKWESTPGPKLFCKNSLTGSSRTCRRSRYRSKEARSSSFGRAC